MGRAAREALGASDTLLGHTGTAFVLQEMHDLRSAYSGRTHVLQLLKILLRGHDMLNHVKILTGLVEPDLRWLLYCCNLPLGKQFLVGTQRQSATSSNQQRELGILVGFGGGHGFSMVF